MADIEPAAPPFTHFLGADEAECDLIAAYFGLENGNGYRVDFSTKIIAAMVVAFTARMKAAEQPDIRSDEFYATGFHPKTIRFSASKAGPAIVYELGDGLTVAMHIPEKLLPALHEQIGQYLSRS